LTAPFGARNKKGRDVLSHPRPADVTRDATRVIGSGELEDQNQIPVVDLRHTRRDRTGIDGQLDALGRCLHGLVKAKVMHAVQQPLAGSALSEVMGVPAWKSLPSWFLVAEGDRAIPPDAERLFAKRMNATTTEVPTNHVAMVSHPDEVVTLIKSAALVPA